MPGTSERRNVGVVKLFGRETGRRISPAGFSWKRVLVALLVLLGIASLIALATLL